MMKSDIDFDIALSFAGEDRQYVDAVALALQARGIKVFYDLFEEADLWGKDLYTHLTDVYQKRARFTVMFISEAYGQKLWTNHERKAAQARAFQEAQEYILPARFDATEIPGVLPTTGYVSLVDRSPDELASLIAKKIVSAGGSVPTDLVRRDFSHSATRPTANQTVCSITVFDDERCPIEGATVVAQADNGTTLETRTDSSGLCEITFQTRRSCRLLIAHPLFPAAIIDAIGVSENVDVILPRVENIGSVLMHSTGYIDGLQGRLNPILDNSSRTYLYADNIAIDGGKGQPASFVVGQPIELEDANGTIVFATIKHIAARVSLVQYTRRASNVIS